MFLDQIYYSYLRQLVQAVEMMRNELRIKRAAGDDNGSLTVLDAVCRRTVGIPLIQVRRTAPETILQLIRHGGRPDLNSILVAEALLQDAELSEKVEDHAQAVVSRFQAFCLLDDSIELLGPEEQPEYRKKLDALATELKSISDDPYLRGKVDSYLSRQATS
jgi:hypothetical protein